MNAVGTGGIIAGVVVSLAGQFGLEMTNEVAMAVVIVAGWAAGYIKIDPQVVEAMAIINQQSKNVDDEGSDG